MRKSAGRTGTGQNKGARPLGRAGKAASRLQKRQGAEAKLRLLEDLVPKLARAIAPVCEVVLHANSSRPPTIRAIGNGHVTNRTVGDLMTKIVVGGKDITDLRTPMFNYLSSTPDGKQIRVSVIPILEENEVIAYIAVNFLVQDFVTAHQALSLLVRAEPHPEAIEETFLPSRDVIERTIDEYLHECGRPVALMVKAERLELVRRLRDRGAFGMRSAVSDVASKLGVSRAAVYNYLNEG